MMLTQEAGGASFAQRHLVAKRSVKKAMIYAESRATKDQMQVFQSFLQAAPHTQAVETHGSVVIDLLKGLKADFEKSQVESTKEETDDKNSYLSNFLSNLSDEENDLAANTAQLNNVNAD